MTEEKNKTHRLFKVAKELNVGSSTLTEFLKSKGIEIDDKNPNEKISSEVYELLKLEYSSEKKLKAKDKSGKTTIFTKDSKTAFIPLADPISGEPIEKNAPLLFNMEESEETGTELENFPNAPFLQELILEEFDFSTVPEISSLSKTKAGKKENKTGKKVKNENLPPPVLSPSEKEVIQAPPASDADAIIEASKASTDMQGQAFTEQAINKLPSSNTPNPSDLAVVEIEELPEVPLGPEVNYLTEPISEAKTKQSPDIAEENNSALPPANTEIDAKALPKPEEIIAAAKTITEQKISEDQNIPEYSSNTQETLPIIDTLPATELTAPLVASPNEELVAPILPALKQEAPEEIKTEEPKKLASDTLSSSNNDSFEEKTSAKEATASISDFIGAETMSAPSANIIIQRENIEEESAERKSQPEGESAEDDSGDKNVVIRAKDHTPKLQGLTIKGKIELPKPKSKQKTQPPIGKDAGAESGKPLIKAKETAAKDKETQTELASNKTEQSAAVPPKPTALQSTSEDVETADKKKKRKRKRKRKSSIEGNAEAPPALQQTQGSKSPAPASGASSSSSPLSSPVKKSGSSVAKNKPQAAGPSKPKEEINSKEVQDKIKSTLANMQRAASRKRQISRKEKRTQKANIRERQELEKIASSNILEVTEFLTANELASLMNVSVNEVITKCMELGLFVSINQRIDADVISIIAEEFGYEVKFISIEDSFYQKPVEVDESELQERHPIVTVMGHVDHGKTSLLDYIRRTNVIAGEAGGITQHIGAYEVTLENNKKITFLDTPGHEAFTAMRARGAQITDIAIIVIAADDQVMPQTREAIHHAQAAGVPMVFAINKIDKPGANPEKIREQLAQMNILVEEWGGKYQCQEISAKFGKNVNELLEKVLLEAEMLNLKANPKAPGRGTVLEAQLDKGRGVVATVLVQDGTCKVGDMMLANTTYGRIKALFDERNRKIKYAGPSTPVQILGLDGLPQAGDKFQIMENEKEARNLAAKRQQLLREQSLRLHRRVTLEEISRRSAHGGDFKELNLIVKGDVDGSVEALADSLIKLSTDEVAVKIIMKGVGQISESDVLLASASDAIIVGFQVRPSSGARKLAQQEAIDIRLYSVIYDAINQIKDALEGMLAPTIVEEITGVAEVREIFKISKVGIIAGCMLTDGKISRSSTVRVIRDGIVIYTGKLSSLKRFKDDVREVSAGFECGIGIENFNDIKVGDFIESFTQTEVKRNLT